MKKYTKILFLAAVTTMLACCGSNETLTPSDDDVDWYRVYDGDDRVQNLRYELFTRYATNVLYSDTIGSRTRITLSGEKVTEYKKVDIAYWITYRQSSIPSFFLSDTYLDQGDMNDVIKGLEFTHDYLMPLIEPTFMPLSFLLCDSIATLNNADVRGHHTLYALYSLNTTLIGQLKYIDRMTEREKKLHAGRVVGAIYAWHIVNKYLSYFDSYKTLSDYVSGTTTQSYYNMRVGSNSNSATTVLDKDHWKTYGFLRFNTSSIVYLTVKDGMTNTDLSTIDTHLAGYYCPTMEQDLIEFIAHVLIGDDQWFHDEYKDWPRVTAKYDKLKELLPGFINTVRK